MEVLEEEPDVVEVVEPRSPAPALRWMPPNDQQVEQPPALLEVCATEPEPRSPPAQQWTPLVPVLLPPPTQPSPQLQQPPQDTPLNLSVADNVFACGQDFLSQRDILEIRIFMKLDRLQTLMQELKDDFNAYRGAVSILTCVCVFL